MSKDAGHPAEVDKAIRVLMGHLSDQYGTGVSLVLDFATDVPIVLSITDKEDETDDEDAVVQFKENDLRFEVSDALPGFRSGSENFKNFDLAVEHALQQQREIDKH